MTKHEELLKMIENPTDDCIVWPYATRSGYGMVWVGERLQQTHRVALSTVCPPPTPKHEAAHGECHNRLCVNPRHMSWKTRSENEADKLRDGTDANGERNGQCKASSTDVVELCARYAAGGITQKALGAEYGLSRAQTSRIINGKSRRIS